MKIVKKKKFADNYGKFMLWEPLLKELSKMC